MNASGLGALASTPTSPKSAGHWFQDSPVHSSDEATFNHRAFLNIGALSVAPNPDFGEVGVPGLLIHSVGWVSPC
jgi:hypothetical protein